MLKRFWRVIVAILTLGLVRLEKKNAGAVRARIIDEKVGQVADAEKGLAQLAGAVRQQTREVARLEAEQKTLGARKAHFMGIIKRSGSGSPKAVEATGKARGFHTQLAEVVALLNAAREELARLANEYEASKGLVVQAREDVKGAKKKGAQLEQRQRSAQRREQLVRTTSSLRGLGGIGDDLAQLDDQIEEEIDGLEGAAFVAADMASAEMADRRLDAEIASLESDADFAAELAALDADTSEVVDVIPERAALPADTGAQREVPSVSERETVPAGRVSSGGQDFGSADFEGSDSSSSDSGRGGND